MHLIGKDKHRLKVKRWKKTIPSKLSLQASGSSFFISEKADFKLNLLKLERKSLHID
jgi:hypothetical protein